MLLNAQNAGSASKRTQIGVHCPNRPNSIWPSELHARNAPARIQAAHVIGLLHTEIVSHVHVQANRTQFGAPQRVCIAIGIGVGIGCAMAAERWVWANEIYPYFYYI